MTGCRDALVLIGVKPVVVFTDLADFEAFTWTLATVLHFAGVIKDAPFKLLTVCVSFVAGIAPLAFALLSAAAAVLLLARIGHALAGY